jgi:uncharacterized protein YyaL (SSP411 family)
LDGTLEDYACTAYAFVDLYNATFNSAYLNVARDLIDTIEEQFVDQYEPGYFTTAKDAETLVARPKAWDDNAMPGGNSTTLHTALALAAFEEDGSRYIARAHGILIRLLKPMKEHAYSFGRMLCAADLLIAGPTSVVIRGDVNSAEVKALLYALRRKFLPNVAIAIGDLGGGENEGPLLKDRPALNGKPTAYVCRGSVCSLPVTTAEELSALL